MKSLDKKQIPQVIALAVLAVAFFGYFAMKMILPTPAAAGTQPAAVMAMAAKPLPKTPTAPTDAAALPAPAPGPGMHDPFVQGVSDQPAPVAPPPAATRKPAPRTASFRETGIAPLAIPSVPALPPAFARGEKPALPGGLPALPVAPVAPAWSVTGVLQSGAEHVAILRSGAARRFVRQGDYLDGEFVVASVTRDAVTLRHGHSRFLLPLGGAKAVPTSPAARTAAAPAEMAADAGPPSPEAAPDFTLSTPGGRSVSLSSLRGRVVVLDFWASWCGWCLKGMPQVQTLYSRFAPKGLAVLSVNSWDRPDAMRSFLQAHPQYTTTMLCDPGPEAQSVACSRYGAKSIPLTVVIDRQGRVAAVFPGYTPDGEQRLEAVLNRLGLRRAAPELARAFRPRFSRPRIARGFRPWFSRPRIARAFHPRFAHPRIARRTLLASAAMESFATLALPMPLLPATGPAHPAPRHQPGRPKIRVADYQSERALPLFPADADHGLLPSGMEAPDFSLATVSGQAFSLSQFRGSVVVLDFWASWDASSVHSLSALSQLQKDVAAPDLAVLAVNSWDSKAGMQAALQGFGGGGLTPLFDPGVSNASVAVSAYRAPDVPTCYVIDREGRVAGSFVGYGRDTTGGIKATLTKLGVVPQGASL